MSQTQPQIELPVRCPFCREVAAASFGDGFAFIHSWFVLHLDRCGAKPPRFDRNDITALATHLAEAVMSHGDNLTTTN